MVDLSFLLLLAVTAAPPNPVPDPAAVARGTSDWARITVLRDGLFRVQLPVPAVPTSSSDKNTEQCRGTLTNGTRPGADYASIKMNATSPTAMGCQQICCADRKCVTWVFVSANATRSYPSRTQGAHCWLKAVRIKLKGTACDNGHSGCISGVVNRTSTTTTATATTTYVYDDRPTYQVSNRRSPGGGVASFDVTCPRMGRRSWA